jgi:hypothetical protein
LGIVTPKKNRFAERRDLRKRTARLSGDAWIATHSLGLSAEKLHALGCITYEWAICEYNLFELFSAVKGGGARENWILVHDLGDLAVMSRIREIAKLRITDRPTTEAVEHAIVCYETCRRNRNLLTHFSLALASGGDDAGLRIWRRSKKPDDPIGHQIPDRILDIRRVSSEIAALNRFLSELWMFVMLRDKGTRLSLPRKLIAPKLLWTPPPQGPTKRKPRPRSSQG